MSCGTYCTPVDEGYYSSVDELSIPKLQLFPHINTAEVGLLRESERHVIDVALDRGGVCPRGDKSLRAVVLECHNEVRPMRCQMKHSNYITLYRHF